MSHTFPVVPVVIALGEALKRKNGLKFVDETAAQRRFLELAFNYEVSLGRYDQWVDGYSADTAAEIRDWLAAHGANLPLADWPNDGRHFGIAGLTDVTVNWTVKGERSCLQSSGHVAFDTKLSAATGLVTQTSSGNPLVELKTQEGLVVRLQVTEEPDGPVDLVEASLVLHQAALDRVLYEYTHVRVPMVKLHNRPDVSWLLGLSMIVPDSVDYELTQAVAQTRFGMNEHGARAKEEFAGQVTMRSASRLVIYEVNQPFLLTIGFSDVHAPIFGAWISQEDWNDPGDLSQLQDWS